MRTDGHEWKESEKARAHSEGRSASGPTAFSR